MKITNFDHVVARNDKYNVRFKPSVHTPSEIEMEYGTLDEYVHKGWYLPISYHQHNYILVSKPGFKLSIITDASVPNEILWWTYQWQRVHCSLDNKSFFGKTSPDINYQYLISDLAFVEWALWEAGLENTTPEKKDLIIKLRQYFAGNRAARELQRDQIYDQIRILNNGELSESILQNHVAYMLEDNTMAMDELTLFN